MADLSDFKRWQIIGDRMEGVSVTKTAEFDVATSTFSKVMTTFEKERKTSSLNQNSGRKRKLSERDRQTFRWIVKNDPKNTVPKITADLNDHFEIPVPSKTVRKEPHKAGFQGTAAICLKFTGVFNILSKSCININQIISRLWNDKTKGFPRDVI